MKHEIRFGFLQRNWRNENAAIDSRYDQSEKFLFFISSLLLIRKQKQRLFYRITIICSIWDFQCAPQRRRPRSSRARRLENRRDWKVSHVLGVKDNLTVSKQMRDIVNLGWTADCVTDRSRACLAFTSCLAFFKPLHGLSLTFRAFYKYLWKS